MSHFYGACLLLADMAQRQQHGSLVIIGCDAGELYRDTYYNPQWLQEQGVNIEPYCQQLRRFVMEGTGL